MILAAGNSTQLVVERPGESESREVLVNLPGTPVRFGISWDQDRAEPSMVMLTRIVPGSAAEQAGLAAKDRVYQVDGRRIRGRQGVRSAGGELGRSAEPGGRATGSSARIHRSSFGRTGRDRPDPYAKPQDTHHAVGAGSDLVYSRARAAVSVSRGKNPRHGIGITTCRIRSTECS